MAGERLGEEGSMMGKGRDRIRRWTGENDGQRGDREGRARRYAGRGSGSGKMGLEQSNGSEDEGGATETQRQVPP